MIAYRHALSAVAHTLGKEVEYIKYHQDEMRKKNAAKKRTDEYEPYSLEAEGKMQRGRAVLQVSIGSLKIKFLP